MVRPHRASSATTERPNRTERGYRRIRCRDCEFNERTGTPFNRLQYPTDVACLVVLWRFHYKLSLRDLAEMFLQRGIMFTHEAVCQGRCNLPRFGRWKIPQRHSD
jgi:putative transposase